MMTGRILVIDDDPLLRRLTARLLSAEGLDVVTVAGGDEGLERLRKDAAFDAVICDLLMPGISGFDVVREIRSDARLAHLPVLVLTSAGMHEDRDAALRSGADLYMTKPFSSFELMDCLGCLLRRADDRRAS